MGHGEWKPVQTGIILSKTSMLDMCGQLVESHGFILTSRFTQDCLENIFSSVRLKNPIPTPLEFKANLKLIMAAQFLKVPQTGSYQIEESSYLGDLVKSTAPLPLVEDEITVDKVSIFITASTSNDEKSALYYVAG